MHFGNLVDSLHAAMQVSGMQDKFVSHLLSALWTLQHIWGHNVHYGKAHFTIMLIFWGQSLQHE